MSVSFSYIYPSIPPPLIWISIEKCQKQTLENRLRFDCEFENKKMLLKIENRFCNEDKSLQYRPKQFICSHKQFLARKLYVGKRHRRQNGTHRHFTVLLLSVWPWIMVENPSKSVFHQFSYWTKKSFRTIFNKNWFKKRKFNNKSGKLIWKPNFQHGKLFTVDFLWKCVRATFAGKKKSINALNNSIQ